MKTVISVGKMAAFTEAALVKKLADLNPSQQSIQTLSLWLIHHRKHHAAIVKVWYKELIRASEKRKITFIYLANDVIQNSKKKGPEYGKEFGNILPKAFEHISSIENFDEKSKKSLERVLNIWEERGVYDSKQIAEFKKTLGNCIRKLEIRASQLKANAPDGTRPLFLKVCHSFYILNSSVLQIKHFYIDKCKKKQKLLQLDTIFPYLNLQLGQLALVSDFMTADELKEQYPLQEPPLKKKRTNDEEVKKHRKEKLSPVIKKNETEIEVDGMKEFNLSLSPKTPAETPPEQEELIRALMDLENSASSDVAVREAIASLPPEVSDASLLIKLQDRASAEELSKKVNAAVQLLSEYNTRLTNELEERKKVTAMLKVFTEAQNKLLSHAKSRLEEYQEKLQKVHQVRQEVRSHLQNLPDLAQLPDVTGGLAPLPSAGDLFN